MRARIDNRFWIALTTLFVICLTFGFYFFYYVESKEIEFIANGYRIIDKIGSNIIELKSNYEKLASSQCKSLDTASKRKLVCFYARSSSKLTNPPCSSR